MSPKLIGAMIAALQAELAAKPEKVKHGYIGGWASAEAVKRYYGISKPRLVQWVIDGKVKAKKFDPFEPRSAVVYRTSDIEKVVEGMPDYVFGR